MSKKLLGKEVAFDMTLKIRSEVNELRLKGIVPTIALVRLGEKDADLSYEKSIISSAKDCGIEIFNLPLPEDSTADDLFQVLYGLNQNENVHGVLLFRPLPDHLKEYEEDLISILDSKKDIDCMTTESNEAFYNNADDTFAPCTAEAVIAMLKYYNIDMRNKNVAVIGRSKVVGKPVTKLLEDEGAIVTVCHSKTENKKDICKTADIIVTSAGVLNSITKDYVAKGQTIIDVSTNFDPDKFNGKGGISGDVAFEEVEPIVDAITPVPGGVGKVTVMVLLQHVIITAQRQLKQQ